VKEGHQSEEGRPDGTVPLDATGEATLRLFRESEAYTEFLWRELAAISPRPVQGRVLEVGCGIGNLTRLLLKWRGVDFVLGIDMDPSYVERLRSEISDPRLQARAARAEEFCPPEHVGEEGGFDAVVMSNVLEHIDDDALVLSNLRRMLRRLGVILILVPAHPCLFSSLDIHLSHRRRYRRASLEAAARKAGLEVLSSRYFNPLGALGWWWNGKVRRRTLLPGGQLRIYNRFAIPLSSFLDRLNPFPFGVSLLAALGIQERAGT